MRKFLLSSFLLLNILSSSAQIDSVKNYVDSALNVLKANSLYSKKVNWNKVEDEVFSKASQAKTREEAFQALKIAFNALGDKHANYYSPEGISYRLENNELLKRYSDSLKAGWQRGLKIDSRIIDDIAYISIPTLGVGKQQDIDKYANWIYDAINNLQAKNPKGWIIDLRMNGGGNIRPMLAGLARFFEDGVYTYYVDKNNNKSYKASFKEGDFLFDDKVQAKVNNKMPAILNTNIAFLIGPGTASSGEGVAITLSQKKNTRSFGTNSAGFANSTDGFVFYNQEYYFLITVAHIADKLGKKYPEIVLPQTKILGSENFYEIEKDPAVIAAMQWLK